MDYWGGNYGIFRERQEELLREAERARLEGQLRAVRRERSSVPEHTGCRAWQVSVGGWVLNLEKCEQRAGRSQSPQAMS